MKSSESECLYFRIISGLGSFSVLDYLQAIPSAVTGPIILF